MKACLIKQPYCTEYTRETVYYKDETPETLLDKFICRSQSYSMITKLQMDIFVAEQTQATQESQWYHAGDPEAYSMFVKQHKTMPLRDIPINEYDLVITADNFIPPSIIEQNPDTLFAYFSTEHHLDAYKQAIQHPQDKYHLFLDHNLQSTNQIEKLPATVNFPFIVDKNIIRQVINIEKTDGIFLDTHLIRTHGFTIASDNFTKETLVPYIAGIEKMTNMTAIYAPPFDYKRPFYAVAMDNIISTRGYLQLVAKARYYPLCRGTLAIGQALTEAAALQNIVIADNMRYTPLLCHPSCIIESTGPNIPDSYIAQQKTYQVINKIENQPELIKEILDYQDQQLDQNFLNQPINTLKKAVQLLTSS